MNKHEFIEKLESFGLPRSEYVILSGGSLLLRGLREQTADLDLCASKALAQKLGLSRFPQDESGCWNPFEDVQMKDDMEGRPFDIVDGYQCETLESILEHKRRWQRPKDLRDIAAIEACLAEKKGAERPMKILVLNGSPKKKSDTLRLTEAFLKGLNRSGLHEVRIVNVIEKNIAPCRGCFGCWQKGDGHCVITDDQNALLDLYRSSDIIIWSFPLYCYGMPSHLKAVLDRTIPLIKMDMVEDSDGTVRHVPLVDFSKIHTLVICGCGFPDWDGNFDALRIMCRNCFADPEMIFVPEAPMLNVPAAAAVAEPLLARFEKAGEEYAENLSLSADTIASLEAPMIPKEAYISIVNGRDK